MAECELFDRCKFFIERMGDMPATSVLLKERYCRGAHALCARFMVFRSLGKEHVPPNLTPSDMTRAKSLIGTR